MKKIREEISALKTSEKSADVKPDPGEVDECPKIKEEPVEEIEQNTEPSETSHDVESPAVKDEGQTAKSETSSTPPEKPKPAKKPINFKERMAAVREKKKKKPKRGRGANPYAAPKPTRTPTPDDDDDDEDDWTKFTDPEQDLQPGQFRAHIAEVERMRYKKTFKIS